MIGDANDPPRMRVDGFKPATSKGGGLLGFITAGLANGLTIVDCPVLIGRNGRVWVSFPGRPQLDQEGRQIVVDGKRQFTSFLSWPNRAIADRWSTTMIALIRAKYPDALPPEGEP